MKFRDTQKVFIGLSDIASFIRDWKYGFKKNNINTLTGSNYYQAPSQNSNLDFVIEKQIDKIGYFKPRRISTLFKTWWDRKVRAYYYRKAVNTCDTFLFFWETFDENYNDFELLKRKNKKIIIVFVGDDVRWEPAMQQEFLHFGISVIEYDNYDYSMIALERRLRFIRTAEKYADLIISQPNAMQLSLRPYYNINIPILTEEFTESKCQRVRPKIVHAPSDTRFKGTEYVELTIAKLKSEGIEFDYFRVQNKSRAEALKIYQDSDIIVDQLLAPGGGKLAYECLAMGKVVLTAMGSKKYDQKKPEECPLIDVNPNSLYEVLKSLILDHPKRVELAAKARPYIEKYHNSKLITRRILDHLNGTELMEVDFTPSFYKDVFIPESKESIPVYNKWTDFVKDCDWYKNSILPGTRNGLIF
jgi:hypothetical protein